jgi:hypothetical protein
MNNHSFNNLENLDLDNCTYCYVFIFAFFSNLQS